MLCTCQLVVMSFRVHACTVCSDCILHSPHYKTSRLSFIIILTPLLVHSHILSPVSRLNVHTGLSARLSLRVISID